MGFGELVEVLEPLKQGESIEITADLSLQLDEAHNPEVVGSNPAPATNKIKGLRQFGVTPFLCLM